MRWLSAVVLAAALPLSAGPSNADTGADVDRVTTWNPSGLAFSVGGGVGAFAGSELRDRADTIGAAYEIRGVFGTDSHLAFEAAHFGVVQRFELDVVDSARLLALGAEGALRFNALTAGPIQPFFSAGLGWTHLNLLGRAGDRAGADDRKNLVHMPLAAGVAFFFEDLVLDLRGQARLTRETENRLFSDIDDANLSTWAVLIQLGYHVQ